MRPEEKETQLFCRGRGRQGGADQGRGKEGLRSGPGKGTETMVDTATDSYGPPDQKGQHGPPPLNSGGADLRRPIGTSEALPVIREQTISCPRRFWQLP